MSNIKKNDWIAINLNAPDTMITVDALHGYGITPDNTGLQSEDYYKSQKQVLDAFKDNSGKFDEERFHAFYESAQRSYNEYQKEDFTKKLLDNIESAPYDIFSLGDGNIMDTSAIMYRSRDPQRTTMGLGNVYEVGTPTFDVREVAQANKARDEHGNILDWSPNERGGFFKGLFRPSMALAVWDEDGSHVENGITVNHKAGDLKFDDKGDPYYEKLGNKEMYGRETLHYWDTITRDDSAWNKIDFMDSDGLTKSIGGTVAKTAFTLLPYFIPGVGEVLGWIGASVALGQTLPVLGKAIDGIVAGSNENSFGKSMTEIESFMDRFRSSQSRNTMGNFLSFENIGDIISSSAGQLFQQRLIGQLPRMLIGSKGTLEASKIGQRLSLGYMAATSATDTYSTFKEAGADEATAGVATLAYMAGLYGLMNINYFKDMLFTNTWLDEDIAMRDTIGQLVKETTIEPFEVYNATISKPLTTLEKRLAHTRLYKAIQERVAPTWKKWIENAKVARPTIQQLNNAEGGISAGMRASMYLSRAMNEGIEETMEEGLTDIMKAVTIGLDALGVKVTKDDKQLDFGLTLQDMMSRYAASFVGGAIGGAVFEGFNHWEGGPYDSLLQKSLIERLTWYERNGYDKEIRERIDNLYRKGQLGNVNLSSKGKAIKNINGKDTVVFGQGDSNDNQNLFVYNVINSYLDRLNSALSNNGLFTTDNEIFTKIWNSVRDRHNDDSEDPEVQLYHFLEDLDSAKALTIQQMGFLNAVKEDADKLAYDIINKDGELNKAKAKIRSRFTDAQHSAADEAIKNSQYIKTLQKELDDKKKAWDQILNGERNGYYMGYASMLANGTYLDLYTNPNPSEDVFKNLQEAFPKSGIENWTKYNYGLDYNSITEEDLKKKIQSEYEAYLSVDPKENLRQLYDMHIAFSEKFAPEITAINQKFIGKKTVNPAEYIAKYLSDYSDSINYAPGKQAAIELINNFKAIDNANLREDISLYQKALVFQNAIRQAFPDIDGFDDTEIKLNFIKGLNQSLLDNNAIADVNVLRNILMQSITSKDADRIDKSTQVIGDRLNSILDSLVQSNSESIDKLDAFIDSLSEDEISEYTGIQNYINAGQYRSEEDAFAATEDVKNYFESKYPLLAVSSSRGVFISKLKDVLDAIARNSSNVQEIYENAIEYLKNKSGIEDAKSFIDEILFPDGTNLVDFTIEQQKIEKENRSNAIEDLLEKFNIYSGGKIFNALKVLKDEESYMSRLTDQNEYSITSRTIEKELETALSFLRVISAVINSSLDGMNEQINLSNKSNPLAITDESLKPLYDSQIIDIVNRINHLLDVSRKNRIKTTKAQQDTMMNMNRLRIKSLTNIGQIDFDGEVLDFEKIWNDTGFSIGNFNLDHAKDADKAYRKFQSEISNKLKVILDSYLKNNDSKGFIKKLVDKFGIDAYKQDPGIFSDDADNRITPYGNVTYLLTLASIDSAEFDSLWKTVTSEHEDLIPLSSQEYLVREAFASIVDYKENRHLFDVLHEYINNNYPDSIALAQKDYVKQRGIAYRLINIDGIGGTGKTTGVDFLLDQCLKKYFTNVSSTASSKTDSAADNLYSALRLGEDNVKAKTIQNIIDTVCSDKNGKQIFDFSNAYSRQDFSYILKRDKDGDITDGKNKISVISQEKVDSLFNSKDGIRILYIDESGLVTRPQIEFLIELAKRFNFFIVASGDILQNKANIKGEQNGIEDLVYHRTPSLTISMRSDYRGKFENTKVIKEILDKVNKQFYVDPSTTIKTFNDLTKNVIDETKSSETAIKLIYSDSNSAGDQLIRSENVLDFTNKFINFVKELSDKETDPSKKHKVALVVGDDAKRNQYRNQFESQSEYVVVTDPENVQGREYDYVVVDKSFDESNPYMALTDFYTMMTRARIGSAIVDDNGIIKSLHIETVADDTASEAVLGNTPEEKQQIFGEYSKWRRDLMEDIPDFVRKTTNTPSSTPTPAPASEPASVPTPKLEISINGVDDATAEKLKTKSERDAYYIQQLKEGKSKHPYYQKLLLARDQKLNSAISQYIDFDTFVSELKDFDNDFFETHALSLANGTPIIGENNKLTYRSIISTIARAILNNKTADSRIEFISSASAYLNKLLNDIGLYSNRFILDLQESFSKDGFFICNNGHIFYTFETEGRQIAIPISTYTNEALNDSCFEDLKFNVEIGSIPVSTNGEVFVPIIDALSEIDGIVMDKNNNLYIGVVTYTQELKEKAAKFFNSKDDSETSKKSASAFGYLQRSSGKSMLAVSTASSKFETGDSVFASKFDESGRLMSATNKDYDSSNLAQDTAMVGVQQITSIQDWFRAIGILYRAIRHKELVNDSDSQFIDAYFAKSGIINEEFNDVTSDPKNVAKNYKTLGKYSILNKNAVNGLTSAIFRFLLTDGVDENFKWRFWQNFTNWLGGTKTQGDEKIHRKGFGITFKDDNGNSHIFSVVPKLNENGYDILYQDSNDPQWNIVSSNPNDKVSSLFKNTDFDFVQAITTAFNEVSNSNIASDSAKQIASTVNSNLDDLLKDGSVVVFPIDLFSDTKDASIIGYFAPFESDIYSWMVKGDSGQVELEAGVLDALSDFLHKDTIFKNNMYRNILTTPDEDVLRGWSKAKSSLNKDNTYVDVTKVIAPLYSLETSLKVDPESEKGKEMKDKLGSFFAINNQDTGAQMDIDSILPPSFVNNSIIFENGSPIVNNEWIQEYTKYSGNLSDSLEIESMNLIDNTIKLKSGESMELNDDGIRVLRSIPAVKSVVDKNLIVSGNTTILGSEISRKLPNGSIQKYKNAYLIGINDNVYTFKTQNGTVDVVLDEKNSNKLDKQQVRNANANGIYLGVYSDFNNKDNKFVFVSGADLLLIDDDGPDAASMTIPLRLVNITNDGIKAGDILITDEKVISNFKKLYEEVNFDKASSIEIIPGTRLIFNSPEVSSDWLQSKYDISLEEGNWRFLGISNNQIGIYNDNDLSTFRWIPVNDTLNDYINIAENKTDLKYFIPIDESITEQILSDLDWNNPANALMELINKTNSLLLDNFAKLDSNEENLFIIGWDNGEFSFSQQSDTDVDDISVKSRRAIYKYLKSTIPSEISDVKFYREGSTENEITAEFKVNDNIQKETFKVSGERVVPLKEDVKQTFDNVEKSFNSIFDDLQSRFNEIQTLLQSGVQVDQITVLQEELNDVSSKLNALQAIKDIIDNPNLNKNLIIPKLQALDSETRKIALQYYKANNDKNKC